MLISDEEIPYPHLPVILGMSGVNSFPVAGFAIRSVWLFVCSDPSLYIKCTRVSKKFFALYSRLHSYHPDGAFLNAEALDIC